MKLTIHEVARVVGAKNDVTSYADSPLVKAEFDSRLIGPGDLFVPLKGARDGHDFIETKQPPLKECVTAHWSSGSAPTM